MRVPGQGTSHKPGRRGLFHIYLVVESAVRLMEALILLNFTCLHPRTLLGINSMVILDLVKGTFPGAGCCSASSKAEIELVVGTVPAMFKNLRWYSLEELGDGLASADNS